MAQRSSLRPGLALLLLALLVPAVAPAAGAGGVARFPDVPPVASYQIEVRLDAGAKTLAGRETIRYANTSAQPIPDLVFHLYLNAFRDEETIFAREGGLAHRGFGWDPTHAGWIEVTGIRLAGGPPLDLEPMADGTLARAVLPAPVAPGETLQVEVDFEAQLPRVFARTGYAGDFLMVGQWFPKLGVWQEGGWNAYPFHANAEFYADFGDYEVTITLPAEFTTGATGLPLSDEEGGDGTRTVHYRAEGVIDFAWTASPDFRRATRQVEGIELHYLYLPEHDWTVARALDAAEAALRYYGRWYGAYPYPRLTVVDVPDDGLGAGGMEYPMLITAGTLDLVGLGLPIPRGDERSLETVIIHEAAHQWWQSVVASNEAEEPWLDEGFAEYSTLRLASRLYGIDSSLVEAPGLRLGNLDGRRMEYLADPRVPIYGRAWDFEGNYVVAAYAKPSLSLLTLERVVGEAQMLAVM
ncbi:MAG: M1 family metallopeptidase, partial [Anaerolineae bacterium]